MVAVAFTLFWSAVAVVVAATTTSIDEFRSSRATLGAFLAIINIAPTSASRRCLVHARLLASCVTIVLVRGNASIVTRLPTSFLFVFFVFLFATTTTLIALRARIVVLFKITIAILCMQHAVLVRVFHVLITIVVVVILGVLVCAKERNV